MKSSKTTGSFGRAIESLIGINSGKIERIILPVSIHGSFAIQGVKASDDKVCAA